MYVCAGPIGDEPWLRESLLLQEKNNDLHLKYSRAEPQFLSVILSLILGHSSSSTIPVESLQKQRQLITVSLTIAMGSAVLLMREGDNNP
jgi:hypothetical protein